MGAADRYQPTYSHGGATSGGFTAVPGTATGAGRPIDVYGSVDYCALTITVTGGNATVEIESNQGVLSSTGNPPSAGWVYGSLDGLGFAVTPTTPLTKIIPAPLAAFWRTKILSIDNGAQVTSYVGALQVSSSSGFPISVPAKYPSVSTDAAQQAGEV